MIKSVMLANSLVDLRQSFWAKGVHLVFDPVVQFTFEKYMLTPNFPARYLAT